MQLEDLIQAYQSAGYDEATIKAELAKLVDDINAYIGVAEDNAEELTEEQKTQKRAEVYGL